MANRFQKYWEMAAFFLPLSLTSLIITLSHSVVNAGVARTHDPEIALAAYALARSLVMLIENPMFMVRQTVASLVKDKETFLQVKKFVYTIAGLITVVLAILGFSPIGLMVLRGILGASEQIAEQSHMALAILFLLPITTVCRNVYHGVAILARRTMLVPISTAIRLLIMTGVIFTLALFTELPGAVSASISFVSAFFAEAIIMRWRAKPLLATTQFVSSSTAERSLDFWTISRFFFPLVITTFVATSFGPLINTGLARTIRPEISLAAYSVGHGLAMLILAPIGMLHQCTLTFTKPGNQNSYSLASKFVLGFSLVASAVLAGVGFTPLGDWILKYLMGVSSDVQISAIAVIRVLAFLPLLIGWREYLWGILMQQKRTKAIGGAKAVNLIVVLSCLLILLRVEGVDPAVAGAWAMVFGELTDCIVIQAYARRNGLGLGNSRQSAQA